MLRLTVLIFAVGIASCNLMDNETYKQLVLDEHSKYRKIQGASNMNKLEWDDQLKNEAHNWTKVCIWGHEGGGRGENKGLFIGDNYREGISDMVKSWYDEINEYNYTGKSCLPSSCHYTQMVWADTRKIGCSLNKCNFGMFLCCFYDPMGNNLSEYPYLKGTPCSKCLANEVCDDGLCTASSGVIESCEDELETELCAKYQSYCKKSEAFMVDNCRKTCNFCKIN
ncbi:cysteine-rich secretory protein 3-like [Mytilus trossulus]|uniref:cysteine-rich secretory protein 3-like n=1 Tax=Mytilus trossulus TaxID=6551 RepID=UPI003006F5CA